MSLILPNPPMQYDPQDEAQARAIMSQEDQRNLKTWTVFDKILMKDTATGVVKTIVLTSGAFVIT